MTPGRFDRVRELLPLVPQPLPVQPPSAATEEQLGILARRLGRPLPDELADWLRTCNGSLAGPGGLLGAGTDPEFLDIGSVLDLHPGWEGHGWVPVAGDGCGNHYVLDTRGEHLRGGVLFIDMGEDLERPAYVVASGLEIFLTRLLEAELGDERWPFDRDHVLREDPAIADVEPPSLLPWAG